MGDERTGEDDLIWGWRPDDDLPAERGMVRDLAEKHRQLEADLGAYLDQMEQLASANDRGMRHLAYYASAGWGFGVGGATYVSLTDWFGFGSGFSGWIGFIAGSIAAWYCGNEFDQKIARRAAYPWWRRSI